MKRVSFGWSGTVEPGAEINFYRDIACEDDIGYQPVALRFIGTDQEARETLISSLRINGKEILPIGPVSASVYRILTPEQVLQVLKVGSYSAQALQDAVTIMSDYLNNLVVRKVYGNGTHMRLTVKNLSSYSRLICFALDCVEITSTPR